MNGVDAPSSFPIASSSGSCEPLSAEMVRVEHNGNGLESQAQLSSHMCSDLNASHDFAGGMMKILPSEVDVCNLSYSI